MTDSFRLEGVFTVLPTAFDDDGALDLDGTAALVRAAQAARVSGITALGVMGEAAELTDAERSRVMVCVVAAAAPLPVVAGISGSSAGVVAERARQAAATGVHAVMVSPSATLPLSDAIEAAQAGGLPIVIQDYPAGSGVRLTTEEIGAAITSSLVVGVKVESPPTSGRIAELAALSEAVGLTGGLGGLFLIDELRAGATGVMTGFALPEQLVLIVETFPTDPYGAEETWRRLLPLMRLEAFQPFSLAARKEVWRLRGVIQSSRCRRPGAELDDRARDDIRRALEAVVG